MLTHDKNMLTLSKKHVFVIDKYNEDARQDEKHVLGLLEPITRPTSITAYLIERSTCMSLTGSEEAGVEP